MLALLVAQNIAFYVIAALIVFGAIRVVTCKNLMHAALWLVVVLAGVAAQYILLAAEFVAVTQVLVYLGAIIVLFLFGIMLTRAKTGTDEDLDNGKIPKIGAGVIGVAMLGLLGYSLWDGFGARPAHSPGQRFDLLHVSASVRSDFGTPVGCAHRRHRSG